MTPDQTVVLARYVRALCPQQKFDEYTADAWHDVLGEYDLDDARAAAARVAKTQPFVSPSEIIDAIKETRAANARDIQGPGQPAEIPDADPDDIPAYLAALRSQRTRAASGLQLKPRNVKELVSGVGREVPDEDAPARGPLSVACPYCGSPPLRACRQSSGGRLVGFHPSRTDTGRSGAAPDVGQQQAQREADIRAAAARYLAALPPGTRPEPNDGFQPDDHDTEESA